MTQQFSKDQFYDVDAPKDSRIQSDDLEGFWDPGISAIRCIPMHAKAFDSNLDPQKPAILIIARLTAAAPMKKRKEIGEVEHRVEMVPAGALVGIWYKPGMRVLLRKAGIDCYVKKSGERATGKPNPMATFEVKSADENRDLILESDARDKSADAPIPFDSKKAKVAPEDMSNVPF